MCNLLCKCLQKIMAQTVAQYLYANIFIIFYPNDVNKISGLNFDSINLRKLISFVKPLK